MVQAAHDGHEEVS
jgi:5'-3' exonuclease